MGVCMSMDEDALRIACGAEAMAKHGNKENLVMEALGAEAKVYQALYKLQPGRRCSNGATPSSCLFTKQGRKGINQDCILVWEEFSGQEDTLFCGVFDGHGPNGHLVAKKVRDSLPVLLALPLNLLSNAYTCHPVCNSCNSCADGEVKPRLEVSADFLTGWKEKFVTAYKLMDCTLKSHPKLNCYDSGTTAVTMIVKDKDLIIASVGDSRAIIARREADGSLVSHQLTIDLKPNLQGEFERITRCNGRVFALEFEPEVARVWMPHADSPGLAMSRALGDVCLKEYGLSEVPEVLHRRLEEGDEFAVLATDGIWDVLSNEDVARIVASTFPKVDAAKAVVQTAVKMWKKRNAGWRMDDCSVVCCFLKDKLILSSKNEPHYATTTSCVNGDAGLPPLQRHENDPMSTVF